MLLQSVPCHSAYENTYVYVYIYIYTCTCISFVERSPASPSLLLPAQALCNPSDRRASTGTTLGLEGPAVDSQKLEQGCWMIYADVPSFLGFRLTEGQVPILWLLPSAFHQGLKGRCDVTQFPGRVQLQTSMALSPNPGILNVDVTTPRSWQ